MKYVLIACLFWSLQALPARAAGVEFNDTFTDTGNTLCTSHTPETGAGWVSVENNASGLCRINPGGTRAASDDCCGGDSAGLGHYKMNITPTTAEYDVVCTVTPPVVDDRTLYMTGRVTDLSNMYAVGIDTGTTAGNNFRLLKDVADTVTELAGTEDNVVAGDVVKLEIRNATKKVYINSVEKLSSADNALTSAGTGGIGWGDMIEATAGVAGSAIGFEACSLTTVSASARRPSAVTVLP